MKTYVEVDMAFADAPGGGVRALVRVTVRDVDTKQSVSVLLCDPAQARALAGAIKSHAYDAEKIGTGGRG